MGIQVTVHHWETVAVNSCFQLPSLNSPHLGTINYSIDDTGSHHVVSDTTKASHWPSCTFSSVLLGEVERLMYLDWILVFPTVLTL